MQASVADKLTPTWPPVIRHFILARGLACMAGEGSFSFGGEVNEWIH